MATPSIDRHKVAQILVESAFESDAITAHKHGVTARTIRGYRMRLAEDNELELIFQQKLENYQQDWGPKLSLTIANGLSALGELYGVAIQMAEKIKDTDNPSPEMINALSKLMQSLSDSIENTAQINMTRDVINARIAAGNRQNRTETGQMVTQNGYIIEQSNEAE